MPRSTRLGSFGVALSAASGSTGWRGLLTTQSGPLSQLAVTLVPPATFVRFFACGVRTGAMLKSYVSRPRVWAGPEETATGVMAQPAAGAAARAEGVARARVGKR